MRWRAFTVVAATLLMPMLAGFVTTPAAHDHAATLHDASGKLDDAACLQCHPTQAQEWQGSQHQSSFVESTFQVAHTIEPRPFCRGCHAPLADPATLPSAAVAELGVACTSCHVRDGAFVSARTDPWTTTEGCAGCHEFEFPGNALRDRPLFMQTTRTEHAESRFADLSCADCHMPRADDGHRVHRFEASRDPEMVRSAVHVSAERTGPDTVRVVLRPARIGHAFPTGDLLRRIEVGAASVGPSGEGPAKRRYLARHFGARVQRNGARMRTLLADDRVPADGERVVELRIPDASHRPIRWWAQYQRVAHQRSFDPRDAILDGTVDLAGGTLDPNEGSD